MKRVLGSASPKLRSAAPAVAFAILYFVTATLTDRLIGDAGIAVLWPVSGVYLGVMLLAPHRTWIFPVVLGSGKRLFGEGAIPAGLRLVDSQVSRSGVTVNVYERAGAVDPGSFEFDEPTAAELERRRNLAGA